MTVEDKQSETRVDQNVTLKYSKISAIKSLVDSGFGLEQYLLEKAKKREPVKNLEQLTGFLDYYYKSIGLVFDSSISTVTEEKIE